MPEKFLSILICSIKNKQLYHNSLGLNENINDDVESRQFYCDVIIDRWEKLTGNIAERVTND